MCMAYEIHCSCGNGIAGFNFRDDIMSWKIIDTLYCPRCSGDVMFDPESMVIDNGWIIQYDMDIARFQAQKIPSRKGEITPELIFDEGYCTWRGIYPADHIDSVIERGEILKLAKINPIKYLEEMKQWATSRMERLSQEGWRKAVKAEMIIT